MKIMIIAVGLALCVCGTDGGRSVVQTNDEYGRRKIILTADPHIAPINQPVTVTALLSDRSYSGTVNFAVVQAPSGTTIYIAGAAVNGVATSTFSCQVEGLVIVKASHGGISSNYEPVYFFVGQPPAAPIYLPEWPCICVAPYTHPIAVCNGHNAGAIVQTDSGFGRCTENRFNNPQPPEPGKCARIQCKNLDTWECDADPDDPDEPGIWQFVGPRLPIFPLGGCPLNPIAGLP
jgi:hypothetical protein